MVFCHHQKASRSIFLPHNWHWMRYFIRYTQVCRIFQLYHRIESIVTSYPMEESPLFFFFFRSHPLIILHDCTSTYTKHWNIHSKRTSYYYTDDFRFECTYTPNETLPYIKWKVVSLSIRKRWETNNCNI